MMKDLFPGRKWIILCTLFALPSFIYWTSGMFKEGLIFMAIALILFHLYFGAKEKRFSLKRWLGILLGLLMLLVMRNYLLMLVLPAAAAWLIASKWPRYGLAIFTTVYALCAILFFTAGSIHPRLDFPNAVVEKQQAFLRLQGGASTIPIKELEPSFKSFIKNTPQTVVLSFLRPFPGDVRHLLSFAACVEINLMLLLFILFLFFRKRNGPISKNAIYLCTFLSISVMLAIGFSVNNLGAIVRYRSIILPLMIIPLVAQTDWAKLASFFRLKIKNNNPVNTP
jgi:hypothetical protein